jgi:Iron-containing redox enzyme
MIKKSMQKRMGAEWLRHASRDELGEVLANYKHFVHRFMQWMGFTFAKCNTEVLRHLLLDNLKEECGQIGGQPSHLELLNRCSRSCGVSEGAIRGLEPTTLAVEEWFYSRFRDQDLHTCLCILGPGTESVSHLFLEPFEAGLRRAFDGTEVDYAYFDVHRIKVEGAHAEALARAIGVVEESAPAFERSRLVRSRIFWSREALAQHAMLWTGLEQRIIRSRATT